MTIAIHNSAPNLDQHLSDVLSTRFISLHHVVPSINTENSHNVVVSELMCITHILLLWMSNKYRNGIKHIIYQLLCLWQGPLSMTTMVRSNYYLNHTTTYWLTNIIFYKLSTIVIVLCIITSSTPKNAVNIQCISTLVVYNTRLSTWIESIQQYHCHIRWLVFFFISHIARIWYEIL